MLKPFSTLVMTGDSVTDMGAGRPGENGSIGFGYVAFFEAMLRAHRFSDRIRILNSGISGETSRGLLNRFDRDVIAHKPDYVTIMIGVNDVWRQFDEPFNPNFISVEEYRSNLTEMIEKTKESGAVPILISPFFIEKNLEDEFRKKVDEYADTALEVAEENGCQYIDVRPDIDEILKVAYPTELMCHDRVHPHHVLRYIIANRILKDLGYDFAR